MQKIISDLLENNSKETNNLKLQIENIKNLKNIKEDVNKILIQVEELIKERSYILDQLKRYKDVPVICLEEEPEFIKEIKNKNNYNNNSNDNLKELKEVIDTFNKTRDTEQFKLSEPSEPLFNKTTYFKNNYIEVQIKSKYQGLVSIKEILNIEEIKEKIEQNKIEFTLNGKNDNVRIGEFIIDNLLFQFPFAFNYFVIIELLVECGIFKNIDQSKYIATFNNLKNSSTKIKNTIVKATEDKFNLKSYRKMYYINR